MLEALMSGFTAPQVTTHKRVEVRSAVSKLPVLAVLLLIPLAAHAQGSPFDTGFNALQTLFTGTIAKVASLIAIVIGGYGFAHGEPGAKKALAGVCRRNGHCRYGSECLELALGCIAPFPANLTRA
jgi:type IV secretion system protein VirB2